ncbi:hypothetical protein [Novipirellula rosea]|uniref:AAA+ ATPase domain-containing protein n=1 Tax=Novipirellula rosea TaxID=1031540 RepID=A0ABP8NA07_9BACT
MEELLLKWIVGFAFNQAKTAIATKLFEDTLRKRLAARIEEWRASLPPEKGLLYAEAIFPVSSQSETEKPPPEPIAVQKSLARYEPPPVEAWEGAITAQWKWVRENIEETQDFFAISEDEAHVHIHELAASLAQECMLNREMFQMAALAALQDQSKSLNEIRLNQSELCIKIDEVKDAVVAGRVPQNTTTPIENSSGEVLSVGFAGDLDAKMEQLLLDTSLKQSLGISNSTILNTVVATSPPALPDFHLSRASSFNELARKFDNERLIGVTGYPEIGKSTAIAEYAHSFPGSVFWFGVSQSDTAPEAWIGMLLFCLGQHLEAERFLPSYLKTVLANINDPLLIIIDDAHRCHDLAPIDFLRDAAASNNHLSVFLVGIDEPHFVKELRTRGIEEWRVPGLTTQEALQFFSVPADSDTPKVWAIEALRLHFDGHVGMLKFAKPQIELIEDASQVREFIKQLPTGVSGSATAFRATMIERVRQELSSDEQELCRRVSIPVYSFPIRVARTLWGDDHEDHDFFSVWNGCVTRIVTSLDPGRYELPELYRQGFQNELTLASKQKWHDIIADALHAREEGEQPDLLDVFSIVSHRMLAGNIGGALHSAALYLTFAEGPGANHAKRFLLDRFELLLGNQKIISDLADWVRWYSTRTRVHGELHNDEASQLAAVDLKNLITEAPSDLDADAAQLGWATLIIHSVRHGDPETASLAVKSIKPESLSNNDSTATFRKAQIVLTACLSSSADMLSYVQRIIDWNDITESDEQLFDGSSEAYQFWRAAASRIYAQHLDSKPTADQSQTLIDSLESLLQDLHRKSERSLGVIFKSLLIRIEIDFPKNFKQSLRYSTEMLDIAVDELSEEVRALIYLSHGDALRCSNRDGEAIGIYEKSINAMPTMEGAEAGEAQLMRAISMAKTKDFHNARKAAMRASESFLAGPVEYKWEQILASVRCMLEAASFAIHGGELPQACRILIQAYDSAKDEHVDTPVWACIAQIAWALSNRVNQGRNDPQPPHPGFSLSLSRPIEGAENMSPNAPALMLGRACTAVERPHRGMAYFRKVIDSGAEDDLLSQCATLALDAAIVAADLPSAARFATMATKWLSDPSVELPDREAFIFDHIIGRTLRIATQSSVGAELVNELDIAVGEIEKCEIHNSASDLLRDALNAVRQNIEDQTTTPLEDVFALAETLHAGSVAREVAWFWCYKYALRAPVQETDFFRWHWRFARWSLETGFHDTKFLKGYFEQEKTFWNAIPAEGRSEYFTRVVKYLDTSTPSLDAVTGLVSELAAISVEISSVSQAALELASQLAMIHTANLSSSALEVFELRIMNLLLLPMASEFSSDLKADIDVILNVLPGDTTDSEQQERFDDLSELASTLKSQMPTIGAFRAVRRACENSRGLRADAAVQAFVFLRHLCNAAPADFDYLKISKLVASQAVADLLENESLSSFLRIRLATVHFAAKALLASRKLANALGRSRMQVDFNAPIAVSAIEKAEADQEHAIVELRELEARLIDLAKEALESGFIAETWSCYFELGSLRGITGTPVLIFGERKDSIDDWLRPAIQSFRESLVHAEADSSKNRVGMIVRSATAGRAIARGIEDQDTVDFFTSALDRIRDGGETDALIAEHEAVEDHNFLLEAKQRDGPRVLSGDEDEVRNHADMLMKTFGMPEDRRQHLEDDLRKLAVADKEKEDFCRHLQPLQNLTDMDSPQLRYTRPTQYTFECTLLGYRTNIETDDIETAIKSMKRTYCDECEKREPGTSEPTDSN